MITPQNVLLAAFTWFTLVPWICHAVVPKKNFPEFLGEQVGHWINRVLLAIILNWGGFWQ